LSALRQQDWSFILRPNSTDIDQAYPSVLDQALSAVENTIPARTVTIESLTSRSQLNLLSENLTNSEGKANVNRLILSAAQ